MLVFSRKKDEDIIFTIPPSTKPRYVRAVLVETRGDKSRIGVEADRDIIVDRGEIHRLKLEELNKGAK